MTLYEDLKEAVQEIVESSLSQYPTIKVIHANQGKAEPTGDYCTVSILAIEQVGRATYDNDVVVGDNIVVNSIAPYELTLLVNFIGNTSGDKAYSSHGRISNSIVTKELSQSLNLSVKNKSSVRRIPYLRNTIWVDVFNYTVTFNFFAGITDSIPYIKQVIMQNADSGEIITIPETI